MWVLSGQRKLSVAWLKTIALLVSFVVSSKLSKYPFVFFASPCGNIFGFWKRIPAHSPKGVTSSSLRQIPYPSPPRSFVIYLVLKPVYRCSSEHRNFPSLALSLCSLAPVFISITASYFPCLISTNARLLRLVRVSACFSQAPSLFHLSPVGSSPPPHPTFLGRSAPMHENP